MEIRPFRPGDEAAIVDLWRRCGLIVPWNEPFEDIERKVLHQPDLLLVGVEEGRVVAVVMAGYEGRRGWINYLAVDPDRRGLGLGRRIMEGAEARLVALGCPKVNLQIREANRDVIGFYERLGYRVEALVDMGKFLTPPPRS